jgi:SecD/SecF fusion protein
MPRWLLAILFAFVGFCLLSMAAFITLPWILQSFSQKVGTVLVYEMDIDKTRTDASELATKTVRALDRRLNPGRVRLARVRVIEGNRIEVGVYGNDEKELREIEEIVGFTGQLEFRILANDHNPEHQMAVEMAKSEPEKSVYYDSTGSKWIARWVPVREGERVGTSNFTRERIVGKKKQTQVLVLNDIYNVTGEFLANARPGLEYGSPCVLFTFNAQGGQLFGRLTSDNLPDAERPELKNQLAIILNNRVYSAPNIQSTITDNGQITGNFTQKEVNDIVFILNAGSLPFALIKVDENNAEAK